MVELFTAPLELFEQPIVPLEFVKSSDHDLPTGMSFCMVHKLESVAQGGHPFLIRAIQATTDNR